MHRSRSVRRASRRRRAPVPPREPATAAAPPGPAAVPPGPATVPPGPATVPPGPATVPPGPTAPGVPGAAVPYGESASAPAVGAVDGAASTRTSWTTARSTIGPNFPSSGLLGTRPPGTATGRCDLHHNP